PPFPSFLPQSDRPKPVSPNGTGQLQTPFLGPQQPSTCAIAINVFIHKMRRAARAWRSRRSARLLSFRRPGPGGDFGNHREEDTVTDWAIECTAQTAVES